MTVNQMDILAGAITYHKLKDGEPTLKTWMETYDLTRFWITEMNEVEDAFQKEDED